jgi:hypothetical protein
MFSPPHKQPKTVHAADPIFRSDTNIQTEIQNLLQRDTLRDRYFWEHDCCGHFCRVEGCLALPDLKQVTVSVQNQLVPWRILALLRPDVIVKPDVELGKLIFTHKHFKYRITNKG